MEEYHGEGLRLRGEEGGGGRGGAVELQRQPAIGSNNNIIMHYSVTYALDGRRVLG